MTWTNEQLLAAIDADTTEGGLAWMARRGMDGAIAQALAAEKVTAQRSSPYFVSQLLLEDLFGPVRGGRIRQSIKDAATASQDADVKVLLEGIVWKLDNGKLDLAHDVVPAQLDGLVAKTLITADEKAALLAELNYDTAAWPGISADRVSEAMLPRRPNGRATTGMIDGEDTVDG